MGCWVKVFISCLFNPATQEATWAAELGRKLGRKLSIRALPSMHTLQILSCRWWRQGGPRQRPEQPFLTPLASFPLPSPFPLVHEQVQEVEAGEEARICDTGRLFVRNLAYTTTEAELSDLFGRYGNLEEVHVVLDR